MWGLLPVVSKQAYASIPVLVCAALSALVTALFFAAWLTLRGEWRELLCKEALASSLISGIGIGVLYYGLVFWGQSMVPASTTSVLLLMEVFFSMLLLRLMGHERLSRRQGVGGAVKVLGAVLVLAPDSLSFIGKGELILLVAVAIPPFANFHMQKARKLVGVGSILFLRSCISCAVLWLMALSFETLPSVTDMMSAAPWVLINGLLILGVSKILWVEAIHRIPISKAVSMNSISPLVTLAVAYWLLDERADWYQWLGCIPLSLGCWLLVSRPGRPTEPLVAKRDA
ncbi:MAG: DMT family transporter [Oceanospirillales bacterium]|nr:DMT family transporter [Oceanospirillales bacterium]